MRNQPKTAEAPIAEMIPYEPEVAALWVSSVIYIALVTPHSGGERKESGNSDKKKKRKRGEEG